jgi:hypothetical protein
MAYIPDIHKEYNLLLRCQKCNGEVFSYPSTWLNKLEDAGENNLDPYGYCSYEAYYADIDKRINERQVDNNAEIVELLKSFKDLMLQMNKKEEWSVLKYVGEDTDAIFGLKKGRYYYWPCSMENPRYEGVIDEEEYTSYLYPTDSYLWEIAEDPTGRAYRTIYCGNNFCSSEEYPNMMKQVKEQLE